MWLVLAAVAFGIGTYWWRVGPPLPGRSQTGQRPRHRIHPLRAEAWSVTQRSLEIVGRSPAWLLRTSWICAGVVGVGWAFLVQTPLAGVPMGWVGYQLPGFWVEMRASTVLDQLHRQLSVFIGAVHDALDSTGATVEDAMLSAARAVHGGPLAPMMQRYLQRTDVNIAFPDRIRFLADEVDLPHFRLFADLMRLREETGRSQMAQAFQTLDDQFRDDEHIQATIRGELNMHMFLLLIGFSIDFLVFPIFRMTSPHWDLIRTHLSIVIMLAGVGTAVVFSGIRRFSRARAQTD